MSYIRKNKPFFILSIGIIVLLISSISICAEDDENVKDNNKTYYSNAYRAGHDDDFSKEHSIDADDYNYGWELGKFCVSGYSSRMIDDEGNYIFLKNVGDQINLSFNLEQDIQCLNGNKKYYIRNLDSRDEYFQTEKINFGHGTLFLRHTDYQGIQNDPIIYTNFLEALEVGNETKVSIEGPNTQVYLLEEGDYEVALDYRIGKQKDGPLFINPKDPYQDYRIFFKFSIRNGNCMSFIRDVSTGNELTNESVTPNGFVIDMANSKYLQVNIKKEVMSEGKDGLVEDIRFNRPVSDGEKFTEEGMYTLTTKNVYTDETTVKKIYVGADVVMIAFINSNYSIEEINDLLEQGATIDDDGNIIMPSVDTVESDIGSDEEDTPIDTPTDAKNEIKIKKSVSSYINKGTYKWIGLSVAVIILIIAMCINKHKKKILSSKKVDTNSISDEPNEDKE